MNNLKQLNIRNVIDAHERYHMPDLEFQAKSQGQYGTTTVHNLKDIAKALRIHDPVLVKHFSVGLNTQTKWISDNSELRMKGKFSYDELLKCLRKFIDEYVLCPKCGLPELKYKVKGKKMKKSCCACGYSNLCDTKERIYKVMHQCISTE